MKKLVLIAALAAMIGATASAQSEKCDSCEECNQACSNCAAAGEKTTAASATGAKAVDASTIRSKKDSARHYKADNVDKGSEFIVISKMDWRLYVYGKNGNETVLLAKYPVCLSKNEGQKQRSGDMKTPSSHPGAPFTISQIQDASTWRHDFKDGRGNILSYGHWFLRLKTPGHSGIGIHGSTNNESSVPGRASEGCIRLRDKDIIDLKTRYARVGMKVIILDEKQGMLDYEVKAHAKAVPAE